MRMRQTGWKRLAQGLTAGLLILGVAVPSAFADEDHYDHYRDQARFSRHESGFRWGRGYEDRRMERPYHETAYWRADRNRGWEGQRWDGGRFRDDRAYDREDRWRR